MALFFCPTCCDLVETLSDPRVPTECELCETPLEACDEPDPDPRRPAVAQTGLLPR